MNLILFMKSAARWGAGILCVLGILMPDAQALDDTGTVFNQGHFWHFTNSEGHDLRAASWTGNPHTRRNATIVLLHGRGSFIEKHQELITDLVKKGYHLKTFDWLGQGGSGRLLQNAQKGHIHSFDQYLSDLDIFMKDYVLPTKPGKVFLLGASMGGHLALRYVREYESGVDGLILLAPMLDIFTTPYPRGIASLLVGSVTNLGGGKSYVFGHGPFVLKNETFETSKETHSARRHAQKVQILRENPYYVLGGPTFRWVHAAFESMEKTLDPNYIQGLKTPVLFLTAEKDRIVNTDQDQRVCATLPRCVHKVYKNAYHNIANEVDDIRNLFLKDLDNFVNQVSEGS